MGPLMPLKFYTGYLHWVIIFHWKYSDSTWYFSSVPIFLHRLCCNLICCNSIHVIHFHDLIQVTTMSRFQIYHNALSCTCTYLHWYKINPLCAQHPGNGMKYVTTYILRNLSAPFLIIPWSRACDTVMFIVLGSSMDPLSLGHWGRW